MGRWMIGTTQSKNPPVELEGGDPDVEENGLVNTSSHTRAQRSARVSHLLRVA